MPQFPAWCFPRQTGRILIAPFFRIPFVVPRCPCSKENHLPGPGTNEPLPPYNQETRSPGGTRRVVKKILKYVGMVIACLIVVVLSSALLYRAYLQHKVVQERAITSPDGINSLQAVRIGGIDQWIEVRGQNVNNPILFFF